jgi:hypothetical protein
VRWYSSSAQLSALIRAKSLAAYGTSCEIASRAHIREVAATIGRDDNAGHRVINSRLIFLKDEGWAESLGRDQPRYRQKQGAVVYRAVERPEPKRIGKAREQLYAAVAKWINQAETVPACLTDRIDPKNLGPES